MSISDIEKKLNQAKNTQKRQVNQIKLLKQKKLKAEKNVEFRDIIDKITTEKHEIKMLKNEYKTMDKTLR